MSASHEAGTPSRRRAAALTLALSVVVSVLVGLTGSGQADAATPAPTTTTRTTAAPATTSAPSTTYRPTTTTTGPCVTLTVQRYQPGQVVASYDFENGQVPFAFTASGGATLSVDAAAARSGSQGLKISGLTYNSGLTISVPTASIGTYHLTAWMRFADGSAPRQVLLHLRDRSTVTDVNSSTFSAVQGTYSPEPTTINGCGGGVTVGKSMSVTVSLFGEYCGTQPPASTAYLDDFSIVYGSSSTSSPTSGSAGACPPPITTTTTTTTKTTTTTTTTTTTGNQGAACHVTYRLAGSWPGGWQSSINVKNTGTVPFTDWVLDWRFGGPGAISQLWPTTHTQSGTSVSVQAPSWARVLQPGGAFDLGYLGSGTPVQPTDFRLNGVPCSVS